VSTDNIAERLNRWSGPGLGPLDAEAFMADWYAGVMFPRGFVSLRGMLCKLAQDRCYTLEQTAELLEQVFEN
jgi:hypothetical protein